MKFLKKFTNETDRDAFIQKACHFPIVTLVKPTSSDVGIVNYYDKDAVNNGTYTVNLNSEWQSSTVTNPDPDILDGVYESFSNYNVPSSCATMTITINGYFEFIMYIRSNAEDNWDYVMVSQLDQTIDNNTDCSDTTLVKAHTRSVQNSDTAISGYTMVKYENIDKGEHTITIVYIKDGSGNNADDRGYVLIKK